MTASTQLQFPMMLGTAAERPPKLDGETGYQSNDTTEVSFGFVDATGSTVWRTLAATPYSGESDIIVYGDPVGGNDANPGTQALPIKTEARALVLACGPGTHKKKCRIYWAAGTVTTPTGTLFPPCPVGNLAEPLTHIGTFADSGLGTRTSTAVSTLAGAAGVLVTDNTLVIALDAYQGYRLRVTSGPATGLYGNVMTNSTGGAFTVQVATMAGLVAGNTFVIERFATTFAYGGDTLFLQGPTAVGFYGIYLAWDMQMVNGSRFGAACCWLDGTFMRGGSSVWLGSLQSFFNTLGIGSIGTATPGAATGSTDVGYQVTGLNTNDSCTIASQGYNMQDRSSVAGSFVALNAASGFSISTTSSLNLYASYGKGMLLNLQGITSTIWLRGFVRHAHKSLTVSNNGYVIASNLNVVNSAGPGITVTSGTVVLTGVIGSSLTYGISQTAQSGSHVYVDSTTTITGTTNDFFVGLQGAQNYAALAGAPNTTISDFAIANSSGVALSRT